MPRVLCRRLLCTTHIHIHQNGSADDNHENQSRAGDRLVQGAFSLAGVRTKRELVDMALKELVRRYRNRDLTDLAGRIRLRNDFDNKGMRRIRHGSG